MRHRKQKKDMPCDEAIIAAYLKDGVTMKDVSKELGISVGYVHKALHKSNTYIKPRPYMQLFSEEARKKNADKRRGRKLSDDHRRNIAKAKALHCAGHKKMRDDGYISVYFPEHPAASKDGYVMEHRLLMEKKIGRLLEKDEVVHHINHNRKDNRLVNLKLMTFKEHAALHMKERHAKKKGEMTYQ